MVDFFMVVAIIISLTFTFWFSMTRNNRKKRSGQQKHRPSGAQSHIEYLSDYAVLQMLEYDTIIKQRNKPATQEEYQALLAACPVLRGYANGILKTNLEHINLVHKVAGKDHALTITLRAAAQMNLSFDEILDSLCREEIKDAYLSGEIKPVYNAELSEFLGETVVLLKNDKPIDRAKLINMLKSSGNF